MAKRLSKQEIVQLIYTYATRNGSDPKLMIAVAIQESNLNNLAVGDGGTSFGLYQHHIGGAGGATKESAMRFLDAETSIEERSRAFRGATTGEDAARIQRPANPTKYAEQVNNRLKTVSSNVTTQLQASTRPKWSPLRDEVKQIATKKYGLKHTSGDRSTKLTSSGNISDHYKGKLDSWADDYSGAMDAQKAFEAEMLARSDLKQVLGPATAADHQDHVHVAGFSSNEVVAQTGSSSDLQTVGWFDGTKEAASDAAKALGKYLTILLLVFLGGSLVVFGVIKTSGGA